MFCIKSTRIADIRHSADSSRRVSRSVSIASISALLFSMDRHVVGFVRHRGVGLSKPGGTAVRRSGRGDIGSSDEPIHPFSLRGSTYTVRRISIVDTPRNARKVSRVDTSPRTNGFDEWRSPTRSVHEWVLDERHAMVHSEPGWTVTPDSGKRPNPWRQTPTKPIDPVRYRLNKSHTAIYNRPGDQ